MISFFGIFHNLSGNGSIKRSNIMKLFAAVFGLMIILIECVMPVYATTPGTNGKIAFTREVILYGFCDIQYPIPCGPIDEYFVEFIGREIYVTNPDGSGLTKLSTRLSDPINQVYDDTPNWSPDGKKLAFASGRNGNWDIYVMNADGSGETQLTFDNAFDYAPIWFPDGSKIAFISNRNANDTYLWVIKPDGSGQTILSTVPVGEFDISPDGTKIVFVVGGTDIYTMNIDGSNKKLLLRGSISGQHQWVKWSPDGTKIALVDFNNIFVVNPDGTGLFNLTNSEESVNNGAYGISWSPDGTKIVFPTNRDGEYITFLPECPSCLYIEKHKIYAINVDGSNLSKITDGGPDFRPSWGPISDDNDTVLPHAVSEALAAAAINPADVPQKVIDDLIAAADAQILTVVPQNTTVNNLILQPNEVVVLGEGSAIAGNIEGRADNTVVISGDSFVDGNIESVGTSFVAGSNVEISGNIEDNQSNELLFGPVAQVHFSGNVMVAKLVIEKNGYVTINGNLEVNGFLELHADVSLEVLGNLKCVPETTANVDDSAIVTIGGNNECAALQ